MKILIPCLAITLGVQATLLSAPINWDAPKSISDPSDVSTVGTLVEAFNAGGMGSGITVRVNTVTFTGTTALLDRDTDTDVFNGNTGDTNYNNLLKSIDFGGGTNLVPLSIGNGKLTRGFLYQVQVWFVDTRGNRVTPVGDGLGNKVDLAANPGSFAAGFFTADAASQALTLESPNFGQAHINGYQLREIAPEDVPDPTIPTHLVATTGDTAIALDWDDNNQVGFSNFIVRRRTNPDGPYTDIAGATPSASEYLDTGLVNGTTYYYVVAARNINSDISANSTEDSATPEVFVPDPPITPSNPTIQAGSNRNILDWDDNTQPGFLEFRVFRSTSPGGTYTQIGNTTESRFVDNTALNGITYYYEITTVNVENAESAPSSEVSAKPSATAGPPNFVFIITDDQDTYSVNAYRNTEPVELTSGGLAYPIDTPNIDRLANEGMLFHQARIMGSWTGAVCTGSRTCIMTGMGTWDAQTYRNGVNDPANTFPGVFNTGIRSGVPDLPYATYRTCKNGNSYDTANNEFTTRNDATRRGNSEGSGSEWHGERALEQLEDWRVNHQPNGEPFMMYLGFSHPHDTRNARDASNPPNLASRYGSFNTSNPASITSLNPLSPPIPINLLTATPDTFPAHPFDNGHLSVRDEVNVQGIQTYRTEEVVRNEIGRNFACVDWIDQQLGLVFDKLEDPDGDGDTSDSVLENTYIVFTSDHGIAIGRHGLQGKQNLYEHTWKVPYIVRGPGIPAGTETDALIYVHETFPTFCDLAGIELPATLDANDGQSFRSVLEGNSTTHRDHLFGLYAGGSTPGIRSITDGRFKLIKYDVDSNNTQVTQMFALRTTRFELLPEHGVPNIADSPTYAAIRNRLEAQLMQERSDNNDPHAYLGDRTLLRFEDGSAGETPGTHPDRFAFANDGTAASGTGGELPTLSANIPFATDLVLGEPNTLSLDFEQDLQQHLEIAHNDRAINFGNAPFTIEAWVKLETLPTGSNLESTRPVAMKKVIGSGDTALDYMFLAAAGSYGDATSFNRLAIHLGNGAIISSLAIPDTLWHHISVALDPVSDTLRFTLDDQVDTQTSNDTGVTNNGPLIIGAHFNSSSQIDSSFDGGIDEFSITDGFLALSEIQPLAAVNEITDFQITDHQIDTRNSTFSLTFESDGTRLYSVQRSATLLPNDWADVEDFTFIPGDSGASLTTTPSLPLMPNNDAEFFRVISED